MKFRRLCSALKEIVTSIKVLSLDELIDAEGLDANPDELDVVPLEDWHESGDLSRCQPTVGSSEPTEPNDDAPMLSPQRRKRDVLQN